MNGEFELIITASTLSMQTVANANRAGKVKHVFGLVSDPAGAGVGISREKPLDHPSHLAGYGTLQPVDASFRLAREFRPELKTVGVVWNPAEANSEAQLKLARKACQELGITLLESNADNSAAVGEAANAAIARGAEALWVPGDVTVLVAVESLIQAAKKAGLPVWTVIPPNAGRGALFDLGADYTEVGRLTGLLAGDVLLGKSPADVPITNLVPEMLCLNEVALEGLRNQWQLPAVIRGKAAVIFDKTGRHEKPRANVAPAVPPATLPHRSWKVRVIEYNQVLDVEECEHGVMEGLKESGLKETVDYSVKVVNAHGDMPTVTALVDAAISDGADLLITLSTPTLQAALNRARNIPIVFTYVADAVKAGAGRSNEDHLPNVTGVPTGASYEPMIQIIRECLPTARRLGTLYVPSEANTVFHKVMLEQSAVKAGFELVTVAADTSAEVADAATALCTRGVDAICQLPGNLTASAFPGIASAAVKARIPVFAFQSSQASGSPIVLARDYFDAGKQAAALAVRVIKGESPARMPFQPITTTRLIVNPKAAQAVRFQIPDRILRAADRNLLPGR